MTATDAPVVQAPATPATHRAPRRRPHRRPSAGHVLMILAGLVAGVANFAVLRASSDTVTVLAAREDIAIGTPITAALLQPVDVRVAGATLELLLRPGAVTDAGLSGQVAAVGVPAGALLRTSDLRAAASGEDGLRRMSIPLKRERAVGGAIGPDDRVDVIRVADGVATYLVTDARVLAVGAGTAGGLGAGAAFHVTVAVDAETALCVAAAIATGELSVTLSTGAAPVPADGCAAPTGAAPDGAGAASDGGTG